MEFEFDPDKSAANRDKHGIDFVAAQELWQVPGLVIASPYEAEIRWLRIGQLGGRFWAAVYTERGPKTRIVSVRRARVTEVQRYENEAKA